MAINKAYTIDNIENKKFIDLKLDTQWQSFVGSAEASGVWIIWGESGSGKTSLTMAAAKLLSHHYKVAFNSLEMGISKALKKVLRDWNMQEIKKNFFVLDCETIEDLKDRLRKKQSPKVVIIDSVQYADLTKSEYKALKAEFGHKVLFIFTSHADGKNPKGAIASFIRYDADVKIRVEGYKGFAVSRFGGGEPFTIWPEEAAKYWADIK